MFTLKIDREVKNIFRHLPPVRKHNVKEALRSLVSDPRQGKALQESLSGLYSCRVGTLRIIYLIKRKTIHVIALGPRYSIYKELEKSRTHRSQ